MLLHFLGCLLESCGEALPCAGSPPTAVCQVQLPPWPCLVTVSPLECLLGDYFCAVCPLGTSWLQFHVLQTMSVGHGHSVKLPSGSDYTLAKSFLGYFYRKGGMWVDFISFHRPGKLRQPLGSQSSGQLAAHMGHDSFQSAFLYAHLFFISAFVGPVKQPPSLLRALLETSV